MTDDLLTELTKQPQRETAGSDTALRFDYQKNWALCRMIDRHNSNNDYMVAFEFHDDVVFFDAESDPNSVEFCQVKTSKSSNPKRLSDLTRRSKDKSSIIGKMLANRSLCSGDQFRLILVSNAAYDFSDTDICASDLDQKYREKLIDKIEEEIPGIDLGILQSMHFQVFSIAVDKIDTYVIGKVHELFEKRFGPQFALSVTSWLRAIQGEIRRKNNYPSDQISSVDELIENKCIGKSYIESSLDDAEARHRNVPDLTSLKTQLAVQGWGDHELARLEKKFSIANSDYRDPNNSECRSLCKKISSHFDTVQLEDVQLGSLMHEVQHLLAKGGLSFPYNDAGYIYALTVIVYYERI